MKSYHLIFCSERSGSNFLQDFICRNTSLGALPVSHAIRILSVNRARYGDLSNDRNWVSFINHFQKLIETGVGSNGIILDPTNLLSTDPSSRQLFALIDELANQIMPDTENVLIKENLTFEYLPHLLATGRIRSCLYQIRQPHAVISSLIRSPNHIGNLTTFSEKWNLEQLAFLRALYYCTDHMPTAAVRYEDIVTDPEKYQRLMSLFYASEQQSNYTQPPEPKPSIVVQNHQLVDGSIKTDRNQIADTFLTNDQKHDITERCGTIANLFYAEIPAKKEPNLYPTWLNANPPTHFSKQNTGSSLPDAEINLRKSRETLLAEIQNLPISLDQLSLEKYACCSNSK